VNPSVAIEYWAVPVTEGTYDELAGIDAFRAELSGSYPSAIRGRRSDACGGGMYSLLVEFVSGMSLRSLADIVLSGIAYDLIKSGAESIVLRPFCAAYRKLRDRNREKRLDIGELRIRLADAEIIIYRLYDDSVMECLDSVLRGVAANVGAETLRHAGSGPSEVHVPVLRDGAEDRLCKFRVMLDVDETIVPSANTYEQYWGVIYDAYCKTMVYDVQGRLLIDEEFWSQGRYDQECERRWREGRV
jgi:hypothetical protein